MTRAPIGIPIVASLAAFFLGFLALLSGSHQCFRDFDVVTLNTSQLGKNLINSTAVAPTTPSCTGTGIVAGTWCEATGAAESMASGISHGLAEELASIENDLADKLANMLGMADFYSVHVLKVCRGNYQPNATAVGAWRNVTNCTSPRLAGYNMSSIIDHDLGLGPFKLNLNQLGFTRDLRDDVDTLHDISYAFAIIFMVGVGLTWLELLMCLLSLVLMPRREKAALTLNILFSTLATLALLAAALLSTVGAHVLVDQINDHGAKVGLVADVGIKFEAVIWTGAGLMVVTLAWWIRSRMRFRKGQRMTTASPREEKPARDSHSEAGDARRKDPPGTQRHSRRDRPPASMVHRGWGQGQWGRFRESLVSSFSRSTTST